MEPRASPDGRLARFGGCSAEWSAAIPGGVFRSLLKPPGRRRSTAALSPEPYAITPAQRRAGEELLQAALALGDDEEGLSAASNCSWFDATLIRKLLPGDDFSENVFGANSCMANAGGKVVILAIVEGDAESLFSSIALNTGCKSEPIPNLGKLASVQYGCTSGNPAAFVRFVSEDRMFTFSLAPGKEPTPDERALLIKLAEHAFSRKR